MYFLSRTPFFDGPLTFDRITNSHGYIGYTPSDMVTIPKRVYWSTDSDEEEEEEMTERLEIYRMNQLLSKFREFWKLIKE